KDDVQQQGQAEDDQGENPRALVPGQVSGWLSFRQRIYKSSEFAGFRSTSHKTYQDGHEEARGPGKNGGPEILRHLAGEYVAHLMQPAALPPGSGAHGQG